MENEGEGIRQRKEMIERGEDKGRERRKHKEGRLKAEGSGKK